jgi:hypothetical protein
VSRGWVTTYFRAADWYRLAELATSLSAARCVPATLTIERLQDVAAGGLRTAAALRALIAADPTTNAAQVAQVHLERWEQNEDPIARDALRKDEAGKAVRRG